VKVPALKRLSRQLRGRSREKILDAHGIAVLAETKNGMLAVQPGDFGVSRALLRQGEYDWRQVRLLSSLLGADSRLIFAGAHIGALLIPIARLAGTRQVLAFEPSPNNHRLLLMNLKLNQLEGIVVRNVALADSPGTMQFSENSINTGNSRIDAVKGRLQVAVDTLDRCVPPDWQSIDLIVMDIEGSEAAALRGAAAALAKTRRLYVEFAPQQLAEQGSSSEEFLALVAQYFKSVYVVEGSMQFIAAADFAAHLLPLGRKPGLLRNLLFTQDTSPSGIRL
jgi:FkbM family methyltransferase